MRHYIGECRIYTQDQLEHFRWWSFLQGALAGAGLTVVALHGFPPVLRWVLP